ncbi:hypothetical protein [Vibrio bivalvicida]|uniref:Lipoprotein n=1 Tax=Vibrio bivalvicida TaxID=1276888 RepID=A0A177Y2U8_9VIBR|nr:hypothetical protein [Vibrio bivalvicida]OAJ95192.1 hypothetical protein APB76_07880 [Vibrio bivalvicida]
MNLKLIAVVSLSAGVVACGGGGDGGSSTPTTATQTRSIKGVAIDGYISGATAFIDLNYNGILDSGEPSAITNKEGSYSLSLAGANSDCIDFAPIVVNVPVGAIDADNPNTPITEPYKLVFPPAMTLSSEHEIKSTTPLTTVLWNQIQEDLHKGGITSCTQLKSAVNTQDKVIQNVKQLDQRIAQRYNIAVDKIYGDFIKEKDDTVYQLAQKMMPAIKKSYSDTKSIQAVNAGAHQAYVDYYWKYWDDVKKQQVDKWYKVITVMTDTKLVHKEYEVSEDLQTELLLTRQTERNTQHKDGLDYSKNATIWVRDDKTYTCDIQESLDQVVRPDALTTYSLTNSSYTQEPDWASCASKSVGAGYAQTLTARVANNYRDGFTVADSHFKYENGKVPYTDLVNVENKVVGFNRSTLDRLNHLTTDFNDSSTFDSDSWWRAKHQQIAVTPFKYNTISITKYSDGRWTKNTHYHNGTSSNECSKDQGSSWTTNCS